MATMSWCLFLRHESPGWHDDDWSVGVTYDIFADAAQERAFDGTQTTRSHADQVGFLGFGNGADLLTGVLILLVKLAEGL